MRAETATGQPKAFRSKDGRRKKRKCETLTATEDTGQADRT